MSLPFILFLSFIQLHQHLTQNEILENEASSAKGGMITAIVGAVLCFGAGVFLIVKKEKKTA